MNVKDSVPRSFRSNVVYKFICAECNSAYVGETSRHLSTRVREHLQYLQIKILTSLNIEGVPTNVKWLVMKIASQFWTQLIGTYHHLKIKEALHIMWEKPILNKQVQHFDVTINF